VEQQGIVKSYPGLFEAFVEIQGIKIQAAYGMLLNKNGSF